MDISLLRIFSKTRLSICKTDAGSTQPTVELSFDKIKDEALRQLYNLLTTFPNTKYKDEANTLISGLLIKTNNYSEALKHLEKVKLKDEGYKQVFQKAGKKGFWG